MGGRHKYSLAPSEICLLLHIFHTELIVFKCIIQREVRTLEEVFSGHSKL